MERKRGSHKKEAYIWVLLRIAIGWLFLWAFFDKVFGELQKYQTGLGDLAIPSDPKDRAELLPKISKLELQAVTQEIIRKHKKDIKRAIHFKIK